MSRALRFPSLAFGLLAAASACALRAADPHVALTATATPDYTQRKFGKDGQPRRESYVVMAGHFFPGTTADGSLDRMPFRRIAEFLAPELAKQNYLPAPSAKAADLLLVVHWGATTPRVSVQEMKAVGTTDLGGGDSAAGIERQINAQNERSTGTGDPTLSGGDLVSQLMTAGGDDVDRGLEFSGLEQLNDHLGGEMTQASNVSLLGYARHLHRLGRQLNPGEEDRMLRSDLAGERYFIIVKAYELKAPAPPGQARRAVWTLYANMGTPGVNFHGAVAQMGRAAIDYFGRTTERVESVRPRVRSGTVEIGELIVIEKQVPR